MTAPPVPKVDKDVRCWRCNKLLGKLLARPWVIDCLRCHARNQGVG